jgi:hypothetical protein
MESSSCRHPDGICYLIFWIFVFASRGAPYCAAGQKIGVDPITAGLLGKEENEIYPRISLGISVVISVG